MINNKKVLCVITARKDSKGLPGKNYKELLGRPLFMWSIEAGLSSKYVDEVNLSSNCDKCLDICLEYFIKREENMKDGDEYLYRFAARTTLETL